MSASTYHYVISSSILPCRAPPSSPIKTYTITATVPQTNSPDGSGFPQCENTINTHSNFIGSSHELLSILIGTYPPPSNAMCLVTMDQSDLKADSDLVTSLHTQWQSLASPQTSIITLPSSTTFTSSSLPQSSPLDEPNPSTLLSSLHSSFLYSSCALFHTVQLDPFYPYLPGSQIDSSYYIRAWSRGYDAYSFSSNNLKNLNNGYTEYKHTLTGRRNEIKRESEMRFKTFLRMGGGNGEEKRHRFGEYGVSTKRGGLENFKTWIGRSGETWNSSGETWKNTVEPVTASSDVEEVYKCLDSDCQFIDMFKSKKSTANIISSNHKKTYTDTAGHTHPTGSDAYRAFNPHINPLPFPTVSSRNPFIFVLFLVMLIMLFFGYVSHTSKNRMTAERRKGLTNPMSVMAGAKIV